MAQLLNDSISKQVKDVFDAQLKQPVEVLFFGSKDETLCTYCTDTHQLVSEVVAISDKLHLSVYDLQENAQTAKTYHVDKAPTLVIAGRDEDGVEDGKTLVDFGVRFVGLPAGHEFSSLVQSLILVSGRDSGLSPQTRHFLQGVKEPVHLQVFVTPT